MTHGEETGPETHQDSAVLTYLEGLLMHPVASGPGATRRPEADNDGARPAHHGTREIQLHGSEKGSPPGAASQHLKKARLLRSGAWSDIDPQKKCAPLGPMNGQGREHHEAALDSAAQGESTLLASLLQSFSSRLQTVAMSQSVTQSNKQLDVDGTGAVPTDKGTLQGYCTASSRLKGLIRKNKQQSHNTVPYSRRSSQDRCSESPRSLQGPAADSVSCTERLKAVASLAKSRSSPAPSPKPSVACSQLALLLSSEAHLQQYSREQALKAQVCGRSASERLAAIATQQTKDKRPSSVEEPVIAPDILSPFNAPNGTLHSPTLNSCNRSPSLSVAQNVSTSAPWHPSHSLKDKRTFDRHSNRPPQNCSSLLLLLLNNHNSQKHLSKNGHLEDYCMKPPSQASSHQSDSEYSNLENSLTKDSSDAESCYSSCSPIDLSVRSRVFSHKSEPPFPSSSVDKLTETLLNNWKTETLGLKFPEVRELEQSPDMKSHHKVTLMQLLLDHRNSGKANKAADRPLLQHDRNMAVAPLKRPGSREEGRPQKPHEQLISGGLSTFSLSGNTSKASSPFTYSSPAAQSSPLDLCKPKQNTDEKVGEPVFTASKLLQNLAQCGLQNLSPSPPPQASRPPSKRQSPESEQNRPRAVLDRLVAPVKRKETLLFKQPSASFTPFGHERSPPATTQIENLLERRTVLQLLLGTASHKEKSSRRKSTEAATLGQEKPPGDSLICDSSNVPSVNIQIKKEPGEESLLPDNCDDGGCGRRWRREGHGSRSEAHDGIKEEQCHTEAVAKYGLLSQLLKQKTTTYQSSPRPEPIVSAVKEEQKDYPVPLPKKRKLCLELAEHLSTELCHRPLDITSEHLVPGTREAHNKRLLSPTEGETFAKSTVSKAPVRDSQGFNVLKQLLLSDNCLKELSQPHGTASPFLPQANYNNFTQSTSNHELVNLPWFPQTSYSGPGNLKPLASSPPQNSSLTAKGSPKTSSKSVKPEPESSPRWEGKREESPDSPPLTRSNPILYYMLQRSNQLRKEMEDHAQRAHCGVALKAEPGTDERYRERTVLPVHVQSHETGSEHISGPYEKR